MGYGGGGGGGSGGGGSAGGYGGGGSGAGGSSGYRRVGDDRTANLKVNNITNKDGIDGTKIGGIVEVNTTSHFIPPSGDTRFRIINLSQENIVTEGLLGLYDAGNPDSFSGNTTQWRDISGNNLHLLSSQGAASWSPIYGGAVISDGNLHFKSDYTGHSWGTQGTHDQLTVEMWYKSPTTTDRVHLWNFGSYSSQGNLNMNVNDGDRSLWIYYEGNGTPYHIRGGYKGEYTDNRIRHLVYTYDLNAFNRNGPALLGDARLYMNTRDIGKLSNAGTQQFLNVNGYPDGSVFSIFSGPNGTSYKTKAQFEMYKVAVYTKALTSSEVSQNYNALRYRFGL